MEYTRSIANNTYVDPAEVDERKIAYGSNSETQIYNASTQIGFSNYLDLFKLFALFLHIKATEIEPISASYCELDGSTYNFQITELAVYTRARNYSIISSWTIHRELFDYFFMNDGRTMSHFEAIEQYVDGDKIMDNICKLIRCNSTSNTTVNISKYYQSIQEEYLNALMESYEKNLSQEHHMHFFSRYYCLLR